MLEYMTESIYDVAMENGDEILELLNTDHRQHHIIDYAAILCFFL
jgi:hypothetical protein